MYVTLEKILKRRYFCIPPSICSTTVVKPKSVVLTCVVRVVGATAAMDPETLRASGYKWDQKRSAGQEHVREEFIVVRMQGILFC